MRMRMCVNLWFLIGRQTSVAEPWSMKLIISKRFVPFVLAFSLGVAVTSPLRIRNQVASEKPTDSTYPDRRIGTGSSGQNNYAWGYHDFSRPFLTSLLPPSPPPDPSLFKTGTHPLKILSKPQAGFTDQARANGVEGTVRLRVVLLASGKVGTITVINGLPGGLNEQAVAAARRLKFMPAKVSGAPVSKTVTIDYRFEIY